MSETVIKVENLYKEYRLGEIGYGTLKADIQSWFAKLWGKEDPNSLVSSNHKGANKKELAMHFLALEDISFEIKKGEAVGLIGRNGAGKSTLLKILARTTTPTRGIVKIKGRISSLLEIGIGFHPELTGRENIYLNGAILGMKKKEIDKKFDEIVDFSEVEKFIDTPVKRYSSGMYIRLAFSVTAYLNSEILILDEVLSVGDVGFQRKCLEKMNNIINNQGRTILFVSHQMASIRELCTKTILLSDGKKVIEGNTNDIVDFYNKGMFQKDDNKSDLLDKEHSGSGKAIFQSINMKAYDIDNNIINNPITGCSLEFEIKIKAFEDIENSIPTLIIYDESGYRLIDVNTLIKGKYLALTKDETANLTFLIKNVLLKSGKYSVGLWIGVINVENIDQVQFALSFEMDARKEDILYMKPSPGPYVCDFTYELTIDK